MKTLYHQIEQLKAESTIFVIEYFCFLGNRIEMIEYCLN